MDTKKKMSNRDKMMLFIFGAILIVAAAYFLVFAKMNERKDTLKTENETLSQEVQKLETMEAQKTAFWRRQERRSLMLRRFLESSRQRFVRRMRSTI